MTDDRINLTRRKILASAGAVGLAGAGAGLGTSALFSDEESFGNNTLTAGSLDLVVSAETYYHGAGGGIRAGPIGDSDEPAFSISATDVKPGDWGVAQFCFDIDDNPAYLWTCGTLTENAENGITEPESEVDDDDTGAWAGELADELQAVLFHCPRPDSIVEDGSEGDEEAELEEDVVIPFDSDDPHPGDAGNDEVVDFIDEEVGSVIDNGSLGGVLSSMSVGLPLDSNPDSDDRDPYPAGLSDSCLCLLLYLPRSTGNEVQTDRVRFDQTFHAVQSRHNDGATNPCATESVENVYIGYEDQDNGDFDYNDFGMEATIREAYNDDELLAIDMTFIAEENQAGDNHTIHLERQFDSGVEYQYEISRPNHSASGDEDSEIAGSGSGTLDINLFDTANPTMGNEVGITLTITDGAVEPPEDSPRDDVEANNPLFEVYDPWLENRSSGNNYDIETMHPDPGVFGESVDGVPAIIVVPGSENFDPPGEGDTIDTDYPEFDEYYDGFASQYEEWFSNPS